MMIFITFLRAIAACLITNAHYTGIYPIELIANGGLIGDILFFSISGYCLYYVKQSFYKWYAKRLYRIYIPVLFITIIYGYLGFYDLAGSGVLWWFIYPTYYHFVASIVLLYIPFYFVMKIDYLRERLAQIIISVAIVWLFYYLIFYDNSYYHIDDVHEPMIRFLFFEAMLIGAWFRKNDEKIRNKFSWLYVVNTSIFFVLYFSSKLLFSKIEKIAPWQFVNQILIIVFMYFLFRTFSGLDKKFEIMPNWIKKIIMMIANLTLEIYLVQYVIIEQLRGILFFPINWIILTSLIFISAWVLHKLCEGFYYLCDKKKVIG